MLHVDDAAFVRAPAELVYRRLTDIGRWPDWWAGVRTTGVDDGTGREAWAIELAHRWHGLRVAAWPHTYRHETGFVLSLTGDLVGRCEFWLEQVPGGTVAHHLLAADATAPARVRRVLATYRAVARRGLWGLKDATQTEVRTAIGLRP